MTNLLKDSQAQADGLGYCPQCDHEYINLDEEDMPYNRFMGEFIKECPKCHTEEERMLYWCKELPLHHPTECEAFHE